MIWDFDPKLKELSISTWDRGEIRTFATSMALSLILSHKIQNQIQISLRNKIRFLAAIPMPTAHHAYDGSDYDDDADNDNDNDDDNDEILG